MVKNGQLKINATTSKDTGEYTCIATNDLDSDTAKATLEVKGMAVIHVSVFSSNTCHSVQFCRHEYEGSFARISVASV